MPDEPETIGTPGDSEAGVKTQTQTPKPKPKPKAKPKKQKIPVETPKPAETPASVEKPETPSKPAETPAETPKPKTPKPEVPKEEPKVEVPKEEPKVEVPKEEAVETPEPKEAPKEEPKVEAPAEVPEEKPVETPEPKEEPAAEPEPKAEVPEKPEEAPKEEPAPAGKPDEGPVTTPEKPEEASPSVEKPEETPIETPDEAPKPIETPDEVPEETPDEGPKPEEAPKPETSDEGPEPVLEPEPMEDETFEPEAEAEPEPELEPEPEPEPEPEEEDGPEPESEPDAEGEEGEDPTRAPEGGQVHRAPKGGEPLHRHAGYPPGAEDPSEWEWHPVSMKHGSERETIAMHEQSGLGRDGYGSTPQMRQSIGATLDAGGGFGEHREPKYDPETQPIRAKLEDKLGSEAGRAVTGALAHSLLTGLEAATSLTADGMKSATVLTQAILTGRPLSPASVMFARAVGTMANAKQAIDDSYRKYGIDPGADMAAIAGTLRGSQAKMEQDAIQEGYDQMLRNSESVIQDILGKDGDISMMTPQQLDEYAKRMSEHADVLADMRLALEMGKPTMTRPDGEVIDISDLNAKERQYLLKLYDAGLNMNADILSAIAEQGDANAKEYARKVKDMRTQMARQRAADAEAKRKAKEFIARDHNNKLNEARGMGDESTVLLYGMGDKGFDAELTANGVPVSQTLRRKFMQTMQDRLDGGMYDDSPEARENVQRRLDRCKAYEERLKLERGRQKREGGINRDYASDDYDVVENALYDKGMLNDKSIGDYGERYGPKASMDLARAYEENARRRRNALYRQYRKEEARKYKPLVDSKEMTLGAAIKLINENALKRANSDDEVIRGLNASRLQRIAHDKQEILNQLDMVPELALRKLGYTGADKEAAKDRIYDEFNRLGHRFPILQRGAFNGEAFPDREYDEWRLMTSQVRKQFEIWSNQSKGRGGGSSQDHGGDYHRPDSQGGSGGRNKGPEPKNTGPKPEEVDPEPETTVGDTNPDESGMPEFLETDTLDDIAEKLRSIKTPEDAIPTVSQQIYDRIHPPEPVGGPNPAPEEPQTAPEEPQTGDSDGNFVFAGSEDTLDTVSARLKALEEVGKLDVTPQKRGRIAKRILATRGWQRFNPESGEFERIPGAKAPLFSLEEGETATSAARRLREVGVDADTAKIVAKRLTSLSSSYVYDLNDGQVKPDMSTQTYKFDPTWKPDRTSAGNHLIDMPGMTSTEVSDVLRGTSGSDISRWLPRGNPLMDDNLSPDEVDRWFSGTIADAGAVSNDLLALLGEMGYRDAYFDDYNDAVRRGEPMSPFAFANRVIDDPETNPATKERLEYVMKQIATELKNSQARDIRGMSPKTRQRYNKALKRGDVKAEEPVETPQSTASKTPYAVDSKDALDTVTTAVSTEIQRLTSKYNDRLNELESSGGRMTQQELAQQRAELRRAYNQGQKDIQHGVVPELLRDDPDKGNYYDWYYGTDEVIKDMATWEPLPEEERAADIETLNQGLPKASPEARKRMSLELAIGYRALSEYLMNGGVPKKAVKEFMTRAGIDKSKARDFNDVAVAMFDNRDLVDDPHVQGIIDRFTRQAADLLRG